MVSIVIDNFNYARYLSDAIDSALGQTYDTKEVIVVDDGSTDESRDVIAKYGNRITPVLKSNGGQASAVNWGFAASRGDIIIFLDADDRLLPTAAQHVAAAFLGHAEPIARVQYRLEVINAAGASLGWLMPPSYVGLANGDLRADVRRIGNYAWPPTSGVAFSAWSLRRILPMPETEFRICADYYLMRANALLARVISLDTACGQYRLHGANAYQTLAFDLQQIHRYLDVVERCHAHLRELAGLLGYTGYPETSEELLDAFVLAHRLTLARLNGYGARFGMAGRWRLVRDGVAAVLQRPDAVFVRALGVAWFTLMAVAPRSLVWPLAEQFLNPAARRWLRPPRASAS
jgi:glycosyltransferase involved in cell wall biosynthesis